MSEVDIPVERAAEVRFRISIGVEFDSSCSLSEYIYISGTSKMLWFSTTQIMIMGAKIEVVLMFRKCKMREDR